jgi:hypothetical protein
MMSVSLNDLLDKVWIAELTRLLPEIRTKISDLPNPKPMKVQRGQALNLKP